jgi:hypothetical protein
MGAVANREILACSEEVWNEANFMKVQSLLGVRGIIGGLQRGIERGEPERVWDGGSCGRIYFGVL